MAYSQNGWRVQTSSASLKVLPWITGRVLPGPVWGVFDHLARRFNAEVEEVNPAESWGYAYRAIRGKSSGYSNHASATAIDLNAPKHPLGERGTFTEAHQVKAIRSILADLDGVVRWGGNYTGRADEMHFEINASAARVAAVAARLRQPPPTQEDVMTPAQEAKLDRALDASRRAVERGNINTRLILRLASERDVDVSDILDAIKALDRADAGDS